MNLEASRLASNASENIGDDLSQARDISRRLLICRPSIQKESLARLDMHNFVAILGEEFHGLHVACLLILSQVHLMFTKSNSLGRLGLISTLDCCARDVGRLRELALVRQLGTSSTRSHWVARIDEWRRPRLRIAGLGRHLLLSDRRSRRRSGRPTIPGSSLGRIVDRPKSAGSVPGDAGSAVTLHDKIATLGVEQTNTLDEDWLFAPDGRRIGAHCTSHVLNVAVGENDRSFEHGLLVEVTVAVIFETANRKTEQEVGELERKPNIVLLEEILPVSMRQGFWRIRSSHAEATLIRNVSNALVIKPRWNLRLRSTSDQPSEYHRDAVGSPRRT